MTQHVNDNRFLSPEELLIQTGVDGMKKVMEIIINQTMILERAKYLNAGKYERTEDREGYANGFKPKALKTRIGELELSVPQTRDCSFYPKCIEKGIRSERALKMALAEMYINGVSTRKVTKITEELCGLEFSRTEVSRATSLLDEELKKWRNRAIGSFAYLFLDARYEKVRVDGVVRDIAVFTAIGISSYGARQILGVSTGMSEKEVHWRNFLISLKERGLHGIEMITSDSHEGLKAAIRAVMPSVPWQRCQFHLQQNAQAYVPKKELKEKVAADIRSILNAPNIDEAERLLGINVEKWSKEAKKLSEWMEGNLRESFTVFKFSDEDMRKKLRTSNISERINKEIKRRSRVVGIFPNEDSCLRLVTAVLQEISEEWELGGKYFYPKT